MNERDSSTCVRGINSPNAAIPWRLEHVISEVASLANQVPQKSFVSSKVLVLLCVK